MSRHSLHLATLICGTTLAITHAYSEAAIGTPVEVVFVVDTTGSMGALIAGAKEKVWYIAQDIVRQNQGAGIKMGLLAYRDRGDEYITRIYDLTTDLDQAYANLMSFAAQGGGDAPESVNQALHEAVTRMSWSQDASTLRLIFLVGDCPPHMDYQDDVHYPISCEAAQKQGIIINTVQCGAHQETTPFWKKIASLGKGEYAAISQDGGMQTINTPYDKEITEISIALDSTVIPFGSRAEQTIVKEKISFARKASPATQADRQSVNMLSGGRVVQGSYDLVQEIIEGNATLATIKADELPDNLKAMTAEEREQYVEEMKTKRAELNKQLAELSTKRMRHIADETAKNSAEMKNSFDAKISAMIKKQLAQMNALAN